MAFKDSMIARVVWTVVRVWVGWQWLTSGWEKIAGPGSAVWVGNKAGAAVGGFLKGALAKTTGAHPDVQNWYAWFVQHVAMPNAKVFSYLVAYGEVLVGLGLILGLLTLPALIAGALLNLNYLLAGTVSINPVLLTLEAIMLIVGPSVWYYGVDHFFYPWWRRWRTRTGTPT